MRNLAVVVSAVLALFAVTMVGLVSADDPDKTPYKASNVVKAGKYRDLTWYRKVKLGTAPFVNPGLLKKAAVGYRYDTEKITKKIVSDEIIKKLKSGEISIAISGADKVYKTVGPDHPLWVMGVADPSSLLGTKKGIVFVSYDGQLLGHAPDGTVISWYAVKPVIAVVPDLGAFVPKTPTEGK